MLLIPISEPRGRQNPWAKVTKNIFGFLHCFNALLHYCLWCLLMPLSAQLFFPLMSLWCPDFITWRSLMLIDSLWYVLTWILVFLGALSLMSLDAPSLVELSEWFELSWVGISVQYMYHGKSASIYSQVVLLFCIWFLCWVAKCFFLFLSVATIEPVDLEIIATYVLNLDITELEPFTLPFQDTNWEASISTDVSQSVEWQDQILSISLSWLCKLPLCFWFTGFLFQSDRELTKLQHWPCTVKTSN